MTESDPVPAYTSHAGPSDLPTGFHGHDAGSLGTHFPVSNPDSRRQAEHHIVQSFFTAIESKQSEAVAMMIESKLVTPATIDRWGRTPLIAATAAGHVSMVQELVDFGADVDAFGKWQKKFERTPLMVAAAEGNLTLVKLLADVFHANDALIAPDGQMALRLAVEGEHKEIVEFLPTRRGGGWRRWKVQHSIAIQRAKRALSEIYDYFKIALWEVPRYLVWTLPKAAILQPLKDLTLWCWRNRKKLGPWCKRKLAELPQTAMKAAMWTKKAAVNFVKESWRFITDTFPRVCKQSLNYCWSFLTWRLPLAMKAFGRWFWKGVKTLSRSLFSVASRVASFLHTLYTALVSFFRHLSLRDIWNGLCDILRATFVDLPAKLWVWVQKFGDVSYRAMKALAGFTGEVFWWIGRVILWILAYLPKKIWIIVSSLGGSAAKGFHECMVWVDPKK